MKFLCPSCKAKYQIGDEKVAGRSVRMKCRKCGYVIQVSSVPGMGDALPGSEPPPAPLDGDVAAVAAVDSAVAAVDSLPLEIEPSPAAPATGTPGPAPAAPSAPSAMSAAQRPEVKKIPIAGSRPGVPKPAAAAVPKAPTALAPKAPTAPTARASLPQKPPSAAGSSPSAATAPAPSAPSAAKPPVPAAKLPTPGTPFGLKSDKRTIQGGVSAPLPAVAPKPSSIAAKIAALPASPFPEVEEEESTRIADVGALAGAFSLAVGAATETANADTLSMPADEWFVGINGVPVGPIRLSELRSKAASGSVNRESLVWRDGFEDWRALRTFPELVAIVDESVSSARASLTPFTPSVATAFGPMPSTSDAVVVAPPVSSPDAASTNGVTGAAVVTDELEAAGVPKRSGTSPAAWIAVGIALMFGLTIGFVLFNKGSKTEVVVKYVDRPAPSAASNAVAAPEASTAVSGDANASADSKNTTKHVAGPAKSTTAVAAAEPSATSSGLKGLQGLQGLGPKTGPDTSGPSGTVAGTGQLDGAQIQKTVSNYTGSVKRACWQPALDTRDKDAPTTARVNVAITVTPSGSVSNAVVNGDPKGYRGLSQCIASRVRGWQFPPSGDTTTVNVPFVFAAQ